MPVHHSPQALRLRGARLHLLQLHHGGSGEAQDSAGQLGKSGWSRTNTLCERVYVLFLTPSSACSPLSAQERVFLTVSNYIFTAIFVGEMTLKVTFYLRIILTALQVNV